MRVYMRIFIICFLAIFLGFSSTAKAACVNPSAEEGNMMYNSTYKTMQFCDGSTWWGMKGGGGVTFSGQDGQIGFFSGDQLSFSSGVYLTSSGYLGIGTPSPLSPLHVTGSIRFDSGSLHFPDGSTMSSAATGSGTGGIWLSSTNGDVFYTSGNIGIGIATPSTKLHINGPDDSYAKALELTTPLLSAADRGPYISYSYSQGGDPYEIARVGAMHTPAGAVNGALIFETSHTGVSAERLRIDRDGNVGIGTTSPGTKLHVSHVTHGGVTLDRANNTIYSMYLLKEAGAEKWGIGQTPSNNNLTFRANGASDVVTFASGGNVGIGGGTNAAIRTLIWGVDTSGSNFALRAADSGGGSLFDIRNDGQIYLKGNVGIGTTAPGQKLTVTGTVESTSGGFKFPDASTQTTAGITSETDPQVSAVTNGSWCRGNGSAVTCDQSAPVTSETDPQVSAVTNGSWCRGNGSAVTCDQSAPVTSETDPQVSAVTNGSWCRGNGSAVTCDQSAPVTSETDPQVGATNNGNWCRGNGSQVTCDQGAPVTSETDPQVGTLTNGKWCTTNGSSVNCTSDAPGGAPSCTTRTGSGNGSSSASCVGGEILTGGGCNSTAGGGFTLEKSYPSGSSWQCVLKDYTGFNVIAYAICCAF
jgi:hypothetical protein